MIRDLLHQLPTGSNRTPADSAEELPNGNTTTTAPDDAETPATTTPAAGRTTAHQRTSNRGQLHQIHQLPADLNGIRTEAPADSAKEKVIDQELPELVIFALLPMFADYFLHL